MVEHVREIPELDLFDGIVVYTGSLAGAVTAKTGYRARAELLRIGQARGWLCFVDADQVEAITPGFVKCRFEKSQVADLPVPDRSVLRPPALDPHVARAWRSGSARCRHPAGPMRGNLGRMAKVQLTDEEWKQRLTPEE